MVTHTVSKMTCHDPEHQTHVNANQQEVAGNKKYIWHIAEPSNQTH